MLGKGDAQISPSVEMIPAHAYNRSLLRHNSITRVPTRGLVAQVCRGNGRALGHP